MDEFNNFYTARHYLLRDNIVSALLQEQWLVLQGDKGTGKSRVARGVLDAWSHRVVMISPVQRRGYQWEGIITADTQHSDNFIGQSWSFEALWRSMLRAMGDTQGAMPLFILEDADTLIKEIVSIVKTFLAIMPNARLLLTGNFNRRQQRQLRQMHPLWLNIPAPDRHDCRTVIAFYAALKQDAADSLPDRFIHRIMKRCRGDLQLVARAGRYLQCSDNSPEEGGQDVAINLARQRDVLRRLPAPGRKVVTSIALIMMAALFAGGGWTFNQPLSRWLMSANLLSTALQAPVHASPELTSEIMSANDSLALLYSVWGYEVDKEDAWCDQAFRAGMVCLSGSDTLVSLQAQGLPWIATLNINNARVPVVIIGADDKTLTALSGVNTWIIDKAWFTSVWDGNYRLMWKPSPEGNPAITKRSEPDDILWLDTMLSRVLNVESEGTGEWSPLLTEKIRQFQKQNNIQVDGIAGRLSLIRLWQALDESPGLLQDRGKP